MPLGVPVPRLQKQWRTHEQVKQPPGPGTRRLAPRRVRAIDPVNRANIAETEASPIHVGPDAHAPGAVVAKPSEIPRAPSLHWQLQGQDLYVAVVVGLGICLWVAAAVFAIA